MVTDTQTHSLTNMPHNDPAQYTVLGWVKIYAGKEIFLCLINLLNG